MELSTDANDTIPGEEQVNVNAVKAEFEDRNAGGGNWTDVGHLVSQPKHLCAEKLQIVPDTRYFKSSRFT